MNEDVPSPDWHDRPSLSRAWAGVGDDLGRRGAHAAPTERASAKTPAIGPQDRARH
ncbi:hypothetical protein ACF1HJ_11280 [Streptomyces sp. NPDC013978]|uniref:hypothetical protein n=1 Tax=Streptomyces sp. NPDC013978 TaxID=3364869 RepID=UPI0036F5FF44